MVEQLLMEYQWYFRMNITDKESFMEGSKNHLFVIDQAEKDGHFVGKIIKKTSKDIGVKSSYLTDLFGFPI
jgi:aminopeptidase C